MIQSIFLCTMVRRTPRVDRAVIGRNDWCVLVLFVSSLFDAWRLNFVVILVGVKLTFCYMIGNSWMRSRATTLSRGVVGYLREISERGKIRVCTLTDDD